MVTHLSEQHFQNNQEVHCFIGGCAHASTPFRKIQVYRSHLSQYHANWKGASLSKITHSSSEEDGNNQCQTSQSFDNMDCGFDASAGSSQPEENTPHILSALENDELVFKAVAKFYLLLEADSLVPAAIVQTVSESLQFISDLIQARLKVVLEKELSSVLEPSALNLILFKMKMADPLFVTHHKGYEDFGPALTSQYLRKVYYKKAFGMTTPDDINISRDPKSTRRVQYVPLKETLKTLLEDPGVQKQVDESFLRRQSSRGTRISDYCDGYLHKQQNPPDIGDEKKLELILFQDAFGIVNPLGSAKKKFKILGTYLTLGNLKPLKRTQLKLIRLAMLFREKLWKDFQKSSKNPQARIKFANPFAPLIKDLEELEDEGIMYKGEKIPVVLQFILGDNLGSHSIGGFQEYFAKGYVCRYCPMTLKQFRSCPPPGIRKKYVYKLRTEEDYKKDIIKAQLTKKTHCRGVKSNSCFNALRSFKAVHQLPPCLAHDLFEGGVVDRDFSRIIKTLVGLGWFNYEDLNRRIEKFKYSSQDMSNKPAASLNPDKIKLGGHAVQNWTLLRLFPLIIEDRIKDKDANAWKLYLILKELVEYLCAPSFTPAALNYLDQVLIPSYFEARFQVYGSVGLYPKHHYLCHYVELILKFGPIFYLWTMRFESFHSFFKHVARLSRNYINPEKTLALKYMLRSAFLSTGDLFQDKTSISKPSPFILEKEGPEIVSCLKNFNISQDLVQVECLNSENTVYHKGSVVILAPYDEHDLKVGVIERILCSSSSQILIINQLTARYDYGSGLYCVSNIGEGLSAISPDILPIPLVQPIYIFQGKRAISGKFKIFED
jgi:hypothetical protein